MARTTTTSTKTKTATKAKAKATPNGKGQVAKSAAAATAPVPAGSTAIVEEIVNSFPTVPTVQVLFETVTKRGFSTSLQTVGNVRGHVMRVLKVLTEKKRLVVKSK